MTRYYADDGEEPGRWLGAGADAHDLVGEVAADDLGAVLSGRDPRTGERLITAQGSAGRRHELGVGQATKLGDDGTRLYDEADAAAALGLSRAEVARMLDVGTALAVGHLAVTPAGDRANDRARDRVCTMSQVSGSYLLPTVDEAGERWINDHELDRCASAREHEVAPDVVRSRGADDDLIPLADAARISGVTVRYLRSQGRLGGRRHQRRGHPGVLAATSRDRRGPRRPGGRAGQGSGPRRGRARRPADPTEEDPRPTSTLAADWRTRAAALGLDSEVLASICCRQPVVAEPSAEAVWTALVGPDGVCANGSVFTRGDLLAVLVDLDVGDDRPRPLLVDAARLEALADAFLASRHVVRLQDGPEERYTTAEMLRIQKRIVTRYEHPRTRREHRVPSETLDAVLTGPRRHLTDEQRALVRAWCRGQPYRAAIGRAGSGKTTTVAACAEAWRRSGLRVVGAAVKGEAARTLAATSGIECETVAWYLAHDDPKALPLDARTVLVVDEASTLSDRDLDALMAMTERTGASLRLIGDPAQHGAVAAGGMFRVLCERSPVPELKTTHRLTDPSDRAASEALRSGRIDDALDHLADAGHLHVVDDELDLHRQMLSRWWDAHLRGDDHPMVDRRNVTRHRLNRLAHTLLRANGEVGEAELVAEGDRRFSVGDRVAARRHARDIHPDGNRKAYVRNGAQGTVIALHAEALTVDFDGIGTIQVPRPFIDGQSPGLEHAYALTSYAVQGSTHPVSTSRIDPTATRAEAYVDITRGRTANHLYLGGSRKPAVDDVRALTSQIEQETVLRLRVSKSEPTAFEWHAPLSALPGSRQAETPRLPPL